MIKVEKSHKNKGRIIAKMNSLVDSDVIKALYKASMEGVKIDLIVRGICCLKPGIEGISENITVRSIIGKYLEHSRIFYFKHAKPTIYISSADWMPRNLEKRFELMTPIYDASLALKLLDLLNLQLNDNVLAWELQSSGDYNLLKVQEGKKEINSQLFLENYVNKLYKATKKSATSNSLTKKKKIFK